MRILLKGSNQYVRMRDWASLLIVFIRCPPRPVVGIVPAALQSVAYASNKYQIAASCSDPNIVVIEKGGEHPWRFLVYELKIAYFTSLSDHSTYKIPQLFITSPREFYYLCNTLHKWVPGSPWKRQNEGQERVWRAQKPPGCFKFS